MLYAVIDTTANSLSEKLIGYHDKKKVVAQYYYSLRQLENSSKYKFVKCKKKLIKSIPDYFEYYLVRFGRNYIPSMFYSMAKDDIQTLCFEYKFTMDILMRIFELEKISQKDKDTIEEALFIVQDIMDKEMDCVISPDSLKDQERMYNEWRSQIMYDAIPLTKEDWVPFFDGVDPE